MFQTGYAVKRLKWRERSKNHTACNQMQTVHTLTTSVRCWAMADTFSSSERSRDSVAWEMKLTASSDTSFRPSFLAADEEKPNRHQGNVDLFPSLFPVYCSISCRSSQGAVPASMTRRCSRPVGRKDSSLHERILVPTSSELVARMRAFSSLRLTPAIDATSLMSSSSLVGVRGQKSGTGWMNKESYQLLI